MPDQNKNQSPQQICEDEIDLRELINVIIKRKKLILGLFLASVVIAGALSFLAPKIYTVSMLIAPPVSGIDELGNTMYLDKPQNILAEIKGGRFDTGILKELNLKSQNGQINFDVQVPKDSNLIRISMKHAKDKTDLGLSILNQLFTQLSAFYEDGISSNKVMKEKQIESISNYIKIKENIIQNKKDKYKLLEQREPELANEIDAVLSNSEKLLAKRESLVKGSDELAALLYTATVQQNISYTITLQDKISQLKIDKEMLVTDIKNLQSEINNLKLNLEEINIIKKHISNIELVQHPQRSLYPVSPKKKQNVAIAGMLSLMLGVFLAFFMEFWQKSK